MNAPELILTNGKVYSVTLDDEIIRGDAVAVKDGKIFKVGTADEIAAFASDDTEVIDCHGNTILPGLCDAHCHPSLAASSMAGADLFGVYREEGQSADEVIDILMGKLKEYIDANPDKEVIRGPAGFIRFSTLRSGCRRDMISTKYALTNQSFSNPSASTTFGQTRKQLKSQG